jgi:hypothetical protein
VQQRGHPDGKTILRRYGPELAKLVEGSEGSSGEMVGAEGVFEPGVRGPRIHEEAVSYLPDIPEALDCGCVEGQ